MYNETENKIKGLKYKDLKLQQHFINLKKEKKKIQVRYLKETVKVILLCLLYSNLMPLSEQK